MKNAVMIDAIRTPIGTMGGTRLALLGAELPVEVASYTAHHYIRNGRDGYGAGKGLLHYTIGSHLQGGKIECVQ